MNHPPSRAENRILAAMPPDEYDRFAARIDDVTLDQGEVVYRPNGPIRHVYFPTSGILSMVVIMEDGGTVEVGTVGREGMVGLPAFLGADRSPTRAYCQVPPCACRRVPADAFRDAVGRGGRLQTVVHRYARAVMNQIAQ